MVCSFIRSRHAAMRHPETMSMAAITCMDREVGLLSEERSRSWLAPGRVIDRRDLCHAIKACWVRSMLRADQTMATGQHDRFEGNFGAKAALARWSVASDTRFRRCNLAAIGRWVCTGRVVCRPRTVAGQEQMKARSVPSASQYTQAGNPLSLRVLVSRGLNSCWAEGAHLLTANSWSTSRNFWLNSAGFSSIG